MRHIVGLMLLLMLSACLHAQDQSGTTDQVANFPSKFFSKLTGKTSSLDGQLSRQTEKYLAKLAKREERLKSRISKLDSNAAKNLFQNPTQKYAALAKGLRNDTARAVPLSGEYLAHVDSVKGTLNFLQQNNQLVGSSPAVQAKLQQSIQQFQQLQAKMQDADAIKQYVRNRQQQIQQYLSRFQQLPPGIAKQYQGMQQDLYYYSTSVRQFKMSLNNPDQLEQKALQLLNKSAAFQGFMAKNSQLAGLFSMPGNYATPQGLVGLQTHDQVMSQIKTQVGGSGSPGMAALQTNLQNAQTQLGTFKDKLSQLGGGSGDMDMPAFKPSDTKTKTFLKRLIFGINVQTTRDNYSFPTVTDFGLSAGYLLPGGNEIGVGASYKLGWGNGIQHVAFTSNGVGLRSYLNIKIKSSFSATGGFEYNYTTPFTSYQQIQNLHYWTQSGLLGITKTISMKSRFLKQTRLQLLWDYLSYSQIPKTNPLLFRVGYNF